jgi:flagellin-like hook-associated protein FlgL
MANIGATTAFYKVETSLTRANSEVSKSMERLATGKQNANAGDRSSYVAMSDTFRLDYVGTKAGIKALRWSWVTLKRACERWMQLRRYCPGCKN